MVQFSCRSYWWSNWSTFIELRGRIPELSSPLDQQKEFPLVETITSTNLGLMSCWLFNIHSTPLHQAQERCLFFMSGCHLILLQWWSSCCTASSTCFLFYWPPSMRAVILLATNVFIISCSLPLHKPFAVRGTSTAKVNVCTAMANIRQSTYY